MNFIVRLIISTLAVLISALLLPGVKIEGNSFFTALLVAVALAFLNSVVKPILLVFTIPITIFTLGLFVLVLNALMIILADKLIDGFHVRSFWWALGFSLILSVVQAILESFNRDERNR